jgi:hypothetical protein
MPEAGRKRITTMAKFPSVIAIAVMALALAACTAPDQTPVPTPSASATVPMASLPGPMSPNLARIYFYRGFGNNQYLEWTPVWLNGAKVGVSAPGSYFYRDVPPGTYTVTLISDVPYDDQFKTVHVAPGGSTFVKIYNIDSYGFMAGTAPVTIFADAVADPLIARQEIARLKPAG